MDVAATKALIRRTGAEIVINVGSAFLNMSVLSACIATGAAYIDTAIHEDPLKVCETPPGTRNYEWKRREECEQPGVTAILGAGFDPGVVNAYARLRATSISTAIDSIDIIDINAGSSRQVLRHEFRPGNQFPRIHRTGLVLAGRRVDVQPACSKSGRTGICRSSAARTAYLTGHDEVHSLSQSSTCRTSGSGWALATTTSMSSPC